jgi:DNA/RNA endonuclease G (NUC1)
VLISPCWCCSLFRRQLASLIIALLVIQSFVFTFTPAVKADTSTPVSITAFGMAVTQNFNTLVLSSAGTLSANTPTGWGFSESGTNANTSYTAGTGSSNTGDTYSFGIAGTNPSTDRALGQLRSGSLISTIGARFTNNTGGTITSLAISYAGEQWRLGATPRTVADRMDFQYSTNATTLTTGTYTDFDALDFSPPVTSGTVGPLDGNAPTNRTVISSTITGLSIPDGTTFWIRWNDIDASSSDDGLAIDDFSITANGTGSSSTNPSGTGAADPSAVQAGNSTLLTVNVTPGTNPTSTNILVTGDLSSIGGSSSQLFAGNGNTFTFNATVDAGTQAGQKSIPINIVDAQNRSASTSIVLNVTAPPASTNPAGTGTASPSSVEAGNSSLLTVTVTPGTNPASTGLAVTGDLSSIGGSVSQTFFDDGTHGDAIAGNNVFSFNATVTAATTLGAKTLPFTITDAQARSGSGNISLSVLEPPVAPGTIVISQLYGGGGNSGATFKNDFVELFNRGTVAVNLTGWTVQYASSSGTSWSRTTLSGSIQPGQYYLVQLAAGTGGTIDLPTPDASGGLNLSGTDGKVALVRTDVSLTGACPVGDPNIVDFVGYGSANCYEGAGAAPRLSNTTAALRARGGCRDTDYNTANFTTASPAPRNTTSTFNTCPIGDPAPEVFSSTPAGGSSNAALASNITINFDEAVNVSGNWYLISCDRSGTHDATVTGSGTNFTLDPTSDFVGNERCTVTIFATGVSDQDTDDPPDQMAADYSFSFNTVIVRDPAEHLVMGNPSGATTDAMNLTNYLMPKPQYALSYNCERGTPNWTSWHLDSTWLGSTSRQDDFRADTTVPSGCYQVQGSDYSGSGFDRGHMTPSADRTSSVTDNSATFLMTNMIPQAPDNNQGPWAVLEGYARTLVSQGNEVYIISGGVGTGGTGSNGAATTIAGGNVTVPAQTWKVIMVLPIGDNDVSRVNESTRTFAVIMPNRQGIRTDDWRKYIATVDQVEALTGYDFFSNVNDPVEAVIEARLDGESNTAPVANGATLTTSEDTGVEITLSASDTNVNNELTYTVVSNPQHGTLSGTGKNLTYTPEANYFGTDSFTFTANDGGKTSNEATISITVTSVNDAPVAATDNRDGTEDMTLSFPATDLLSNDAAGPANESAQSIVIEDVITTPNTHGTVTLAGGTITYQPATNFNGVASFDYSVCDNGTTNNGAADVRCSTSTVTVTVASVNDPPVTTDDSATTDEDTPVTADVVANDTDVDGDTLTLASVGAATHGTVAIGDGKAIFTPNADYSGPASFAYTVTDGHGGSANGTVNVMVQAVNDAPVANTDSATTAEDTSVVIDALSNDTDVDGDTLTITGAAAGAHGTVNIITSGPDQGKLRYTPSLNENGADAFTYTVSDGHGGTATGTVNVTITPVNDAPVLGNVPAANVSIPEQSAYTFTATATDIDDSSSSLFFSLAGAPAGATINPQTGEFSWTPTEAQGGTGTSFTFTVRVSDGTDTDDAVITLSVNEVNSAPSLNPIGNKTVLLGSSLSFTASGVDVDLPAQTLSYSLTGAVPAGATMNSSTGVFSWTPTVEQAGAVYTFNVRVTDDAGLFTEERISVGAAHSWSNVLSPINPNGSSVFNLGRTVPVRFRLTEASAGITSLTARLTLAKVSDGITGTEVEAGSTSEATTGNLFRYAGDGQYIFNLSTQGLTPGTYQLRINMGEGVERIVLISLRN